MIVAFPERDEVTVTLVGRQIEKRQQVDAYLCLYESLGLFEPRAAIPVGHDQTRRGCVVTCELGWSRGRG